LKTVLIFILIVGFTLLGYHGFDWWKSRQQRKELFLYFQQNSPITQRIPEDAVAYINLYDFKRVHAGLRDTRFYDTLAHWIDTELSGNKNPNPLMGGMLEKTILNVIGEEFGLAVLPPKHRSPELFAVARLTPGSDFILGIALTSNRRIKKISVDNESVYLITGDAALGNAYVAIDSGYAYASTDFQRVKNALEKGLSAGPSFLRQSSVTQVPENTFLFARAKGPDFFAIVYGGSNKFTLNALSGSRIYSSLPPIPGDHAVFQFQTNATEILGQPATSYTLHSIQGLPSSRLAFGFPSQSQAKQFGSTLLNGNGAAAHVNLSNGSCVPLRIDNTEWTFCLRGRSLLLAEEHLDFQVAKAALTEITPTKMPVTLRIQNDAKALDGYYQKIKDGDWNDFHTAREFYFLSCLKTLSGSIDSNNDEITAQIQ
jgi:hypothetical protein